METSELKKLALNLRQIYEKRLTSVSSIKIDEIFHKVCYVIQQGADPNLKIEQLPILSYFIHFDRGFTINRFEILLNLGCELGTMDDHWSPIVYIFGDYKDQLVQFLLDKKIIDPSDYIHRACNHRIDNYQSMNIIKSLINAGADLFMKDKHNKLPINHAEYRNSSDNESVKLLKDTMERQLSSIRETSLNRLMINLTIT